MSALIQAYSLWIQVLNLLCITFFFLGAEGFRGLLPCEYSEQETTCCGLRVGLWLLLVRIRIRASSIPMVAKE